jgi:hypothetical protein
MYRIRPIENFRAEVRDPDLVTLVCSLLPDLRGCNDPARPVHITTFNGCYGPAGVVVAVNGSPPKGIIVCNTSADWAVAAYAAKSVIIGWFGDHAEDYKRLIDLLVKHGAVTAK